MRRIETAIATATCPRPATDLGIYRTDPVGYARDILGIPFLWDAVEDILRRLLIQPYVVDVDSAHNVGKTHAAAVAVNWWFDTRNPGVVISTAPTQRDVEDLLWTEVRLLRQAARERLPDWFKPHAPEMWESPDHWAKGYTARKGESLAADTIIDTPTGRKRFGDLQPGEEVFGADGKPTRILSVHHNGVRPAYRVTISTGQVVIADGDHLWPVVNANNGARGWLANRYGRRQSPLEIITTREMIRRGVTFRHGSRLRNKFYLPMPGMVQYPCRPVVIPPYTLGVWLGDGTCHDGSITSADIEMADLLSADNCSTATRRVVRRKTSIMTVPGLRAKLRSLNLLGGSTSSKRVPREYMENDGSVRLAVLQGLMDTDGTAAKDGGSSFCSTSRGLAEDVVWLARSLGWRASLRKQCKIKRRPCGGTYLPIYTANVRADGQSLFRLDRKGSRKKAVVRPWRPSISAIESCGETDMVCITVAAPDGLFLANDFVVTHNSFQGRHRPNMLFVFDEKEGVEANYFTAVKTMFRPGSGDAILRIGNPTTTTSAAYQERRRLNANGEPTCHLIRLSALDHPNITGETLAVAGAVTPNQVDQWIADWCDPVVLGDERETDIDWRGRRYRPGPIGEARILGLRPSAGTFGVWSEAVWKLVDGVGPEPAVGLLPEIGCDCANYGTDYTVFHVRCGTVSLYHQAVNGWDHFKIGARLLELARDWATWANGRRDPKASPIDPKTLAIKIDDDATGRAICTYLSTNGQRCVPVNAGGTPMRPDLYPNVRSELWFFAARKAAQGLLHLGRLDVATRQRIESQALAPQWWPDVAGRRVVEDKDTLRDPKRLGRSPDDMDAVNLAYYETQGSIVEVVPKMAVPSPTFQRDRERVRSRLFRR